MDRCGSQTIRASCSWFEVGSQGTRDLMPGAGLLGPRWALMAAAFTHQQIVQQAEYQTAHAAIHNGIKRAYDDTAEASAGMVAWIDRI